MFLVIMLHGPSSHKHSEQYTRQCFYVFAMFQESSLYSPSARLEIGNMARLLIFMDFTFNPEAYVCE